MAKSQNSFYKEGKAYARERRKSFLENIDNRPYWQWVAVVDPSTRPAHIELHEKVFRYDDSIWEKYWPPIDKTCRCRVRALSERDMEKRGLILSDGQKFLSIIK
jgi:SPP1 gp7 family putative phage head morphogenesis protein